MSSAAKLRNRGIAVVGAAAIVMTSFGPAAFAFTAPDADPSTPGVQVDADPTTPGVQTVDSANDAGAASIGLVDVDKTKAGTQGATIVTPGATSDLGEVRFVIPATFETGDSYSFKVGPTAPADPTKRVSFASTPAIAFDPQAYAFDTHVSDYSPTYSAAGTEKTSSEAKGATEINKLTKYAPDNSASMPAAAPQFDVTLSSSGNGNFNDVVTVTFKNNSDPAASSAKFIGSLKAKVDAGTNVTGDITVAATAQDAAGGSANGVTPVFYGDVATEVRNVTVAGYVPAATLTVADGSVVADGTDQFVGPLTVQAANGQNLAGTVSATIDGATFVTSVPVTAVSYDAAGKVLSTQTVSPSATGVSVTAPANTTKVVFSGMAVKAPKTSRSVTYSLASAGALNLPSGMLGAAAGDLHQLDITAPPAVTDSQATASALPTRIGGQDRYQTAVKIAERDLGTDENGPRGESDNVVIASGEGFADALSAGYLAVTKNAQLILTRQGSLPQTDVEFLKTYGAKNVFIVGGYGSVSKAVEDQLKSMQSYDVQSAVTSTTETKTYGQTFGTPSNGFTLRSSSVTGVSAAADAAPGIFTVNLTRTSGSDGSVASTNDVALVGPGAAGWTVTAVSVGDNTPGTVTLTNAAGSQVVLNVPAAPDNTDAALNTTSFQATQTTGTTTIPGAAGDASMAQGDARKVVPLQANLTVTRLAGADRFETNKKVNMYAAATATNPVGTTIPEYGKPARKTAILANGMAPWDALAAGPLVGNQADNTQYALPVVLTRGTDSMTQFAADQIGQMDIKHLLFVGGKGVLPDALATETQGRGVSMTRLGGDSRWATAKAISDFALKTAGASATNTAPGFGLPGQYGTQPYLANGGSMDGNTGSAVAQNGWADALAAGPSAARAHRIIALTDSEALPQETKDLLTQNRAVLNPVIALGLGGAVSTAVVGQANAAVAD